MGLEALSNFRCLLRDPSEPLARGPELAAGYRELPRWLIGEFMEPF